MEEGGQPREVVEGQEGEVVLHLMVEVEVRVVVEEQVEEEDHLKKGVGLEAPLAQQPVFLAPHFPLPAALASASPSPAWTDGSKQSTFITKPPWKRCPVPYENEATAQHIVLKANI